MDTELWANWQQSGQPWPIYQATVPAFQDQSLKRKAAPESSQSGLVGLTLAKELVEHMGGELGVHSTPGAGATFYFVLPAQAHIA